MSSVPFCRSQVTAFLLFAAILNCVALPCPAADPAVAEQQFETLRKRFEDEKAKFFADYEKAKSEEERNQLSYPASTMVADFLKLEEAHRGTQVGLSALHQLVSQAGGGGPPEIEEGRQQALRILAAHYLEHSDLDVLFDWLMSGSNGPEHKPFLRRAAESPHRHVRAAARLTLGQFLGREAEFPALFDSMLALMAADPTKNADAIKRIQDLRGKWGDANPDASRAEALRLLDAVIAEYGDVPEPPRTGYGPILLKIERTPADPLTKQDRRPIADRAESTRFELTHLSIGQAAPEIAGTDAFGSPLKLSDHRGRVVVLMFSFKGCGPCEAMYPSNRQLVETYRGRPFAFLGIMGDQTIDTVKEAVAEKKITWPLWWDGPGTRGPLATRWNVRGWPDIYVLDHRGIIRYRELRDDLLSQAVAQLVAAAEQAP